LNKFKFLGKPLFSKIIRWSCCLKAKS